MKRKAKEKKVKIIWKQAEGLSELEMQQRLHHAYDILFNSVLENEKKKRI